MATLEEEYKKYTGEGYDQVNSMYDAQKQSQLAGLESAYNQNLSNAEASRDALGQQYQTRANDLAVQYERQRRNLNEQAAANGLNTGAGSQMQLALGSNYQRDYGGLRTAQQQAVDTANRGIDQLKASYQSAVQQAVADNDYQRAQALLAEYKNQYSRQLQQAQTLASYGDFSAYLNVPGYSQQQVDAMRNTWIAENPGIAYSTGQISADQYYAMTGKWPAGYTQPGAGNGGPAQNPPQDPPQDPPKDPLTVEELEKQQAQQDYAFSLMQAAANPYTAPVAALLQATGGALGIGNGAGAPQANAQAQTRQAPAAGGRYRYLPYTFERDASGRIVRNQEREAAVDAENYLREMVNSGKITQEQANQIRRGG